MGTLALIAAAVAIVAIWITRNALRSASESESKLAVALRTGADQSKELDRIRVRSAELDAQHEQEMRRALAEYERRAQECASHIEKKDREVASILSEASSGFPWLARAIAHYETLEDFEAAQQLRTKKHPAVKAAAQVRETAERSREFRAEYHIARSRIDYYEGLFPWLAEYVDVDLDTLIQITKLAESEDVDDDPVRRYLAPGEYQQLSVIERDQLALERYLTKRKSPWELGRDYERFVGYQFEQQGYGVEYQGIAEGLADLGRDLVATRGPKTFVIQCKYWAQHKTIHEKHVAQLFGTTVKYRIEHGTIDDDSVRGVFVTSTKLSPMAIAFSEQLGIAVQENHRLAPYPMVKCNIGRGEWGQKTRIYHLPMNQMYDRTRIHKTGECYVATVEEAHAMGFRRAHRWRGSSDS